MISKKLHSSWPWFLLTALLGLIPVLNNKYPASFFPAVPAGAIELITVFGGALTAAMGFARAWAILQRRSRARMFLQDVGVVPAKEPSENDLANSGRFISRLVRNAESDLAEIKPDFTVGSLRRLSRFLPVLLEEIQSEEDARVRLGVVGVYLGETACRQLGWQWEFRTDPASKQFTYLASRLRKGDRTLEVFGPARGLMMGTVKMAAFLGDARK